MAPTSAARARSPQFIAAGSQPETAVSMASIEQRYFVDRREVAALIVLRQLGDPDEVVVGLVVIKRDVRSVVISFEGRGEWFAPVLEVLRRVSLGAIDLGGPPRLVGLDLHLPP